MERAGFASHPLLKVLGTVLLALGFLAPALCRLVPRHAWHLERTLDLRPQCVVAIAFSPDRHRLAAACADWTGHHGGVVLYDTPTARKLGSLPGCTAEMVTVSFSPDGRSLVGAGYAGARLWDVASGSLRAAPAWRRWWVCEAAFSPDGGTLATWGWPHFALWDSGTGRAKLRLLWTRHDGGVSSLSFSPDGRTIAAGGGALLPPTRLRLWDERNGTLNLKLDEPSDWINLFGYSPDGRFLACGHYNNDTLALRDGFTGSIIRILRAHRGRMRCAAFSPDSRLLVTGSGDRHCPGEVELWDPVSGEHLETVGHHASEVLSVAFSPDGTRLASAGMDGIIRIWRGPAPAARHSAQR